MSTGTRIRVNDVSLRVAGSDVSISVRVRLDSPYLVLFMHGLGCAKSGFDDVFQVDSLDGFSICTFDFPGHGDSPPLDADRYSLDIYADVVCALVRRLSPEGLLLVGHSMGGAVGLIATQSLKLPVGFVSIEGNLLAGDCGLVSRQMATQSLDEFITHGHPGFLSALRGSARRDSRAWARWYGMAAPAAIHGSARSLVKWSESGKLLQFFTAIGHRAYCYGTEGDRISHLLPYLDRVDMYPISGAGHFPMVDNPTELYDLISTAARAILPRRLTTATQ
jgi:pimeloyl-ACP methyl ester carboxylesterase